MKLKYLPVEDRQNLRVLRHTNDKQVMIAILESIFRRSYYTLQTLWEYRKWFYELTKEDLLKAHSFSANHKKLLGKDKNCGCFYCLRVFEPKEIKDWIREVSMLISFLEKRKSNEVSFYFAGADFCC